MFNPFVWFDCKALSVTQKSCDKVQVITGVTKFALERLFVVAVVCLYLVGDTVGQVFGSTLFRAFAIFGGSILILCSIVEERLFLKTGLLITWLVHDRTCRISFSLLLVTCAVTLIALLAVYGNQIPVTIRIAGHAFGAMGICMLLHVYIAACIPRPPSKSKMREWREKALTWLNDALKPAPVLAPATIPAR